MKPLIFIFVFLFYLPFANAADELGTKGNEDDTKRNIAVGTIDYLEFDFPTNLSVGNQSILKAENGASLNQWKITPLKKGTTSVDITDPKGKLIKQYVYEVTTNDLSPQVVAIRKLLQDIEGITIESVQDKIVIDGELIVPRDFDRILQVQQAYPNVLNLVSLSKISREAIARRMQKKINDDPEGVNVQVEIINDTFFLLGKVDSQNARERAETIAQTFMPEIINSQAVKEGVLAQGSKKYSIRNLIMLEEAPPAPAPKMVRVTYHFVEIGKEFLKNSFFKWVPLVQEGSGLQFGQSTTGGVTTSSNGSFTGVISNLLPKLQSGANGGFARILDSAVTIGEEGQPMKLVRNDMIPYIATNQNGVPVPDNQPVGITVGVTPQVLGDDKVRLQSSFQFQAFKGAGGGGKPATTFTALDNSVIMKSGDSAALGGFISNDTAKDIDRDPEQQGQIQGSALFTLLRSKAFRNKKTQFVVFITPKIITDAGEGTADIKAKIINNNKKRRRIVN